MILAFLTSFDLCLDDARPAVLKQRSETNLSSETNLRTDRVFVGSHDVTLAQALPVDQQFDPEKTGEQKYYLCTCA